MLQGFWVRNFKSLRQFGVGSCFPKFVYIEDESEFLPYTLSPVTFFAGASGSGKSSVVDAFSFVSDCYKHGVAGACLKRGGFDAIYSQSGKGAITFGFQFKQKGEADVATYAISLFRTKNKVPYIETEILSYRQGEDAKPILFLQNGAEKSIRYLIPDKELSAADLTKIEFTDHNRLGLAALESHPRFPVLASLRTMFEDWTLCSFTPDPARGLDKSLPRRHDSSHGLSLSGLVRYVIQHHKGDLKSLLQRVAVNIPNVEKISVDDTNPDKPMVAFVLFDRDYPIPITHLSSATIRLFTYTLLMEENVPALLTIIDEPENGLDLAHRKKLSATFKRFEKMRRPENPQLLISTHCPDILNNQHPSQVWMMEKDRDGFTAVERASDSMVFQSEADYSNPQWFTELFSQFEL